MTYCLTDSCSDHLSYKSSRILACSEAIHSTMEMRLNCKWQIVDDRLSVIIKLASVYWMESFLMVTLTDYTISFHLSVKLAVATNFRNWNVFCVLVLFLKSLSLE